MVVDSVASGNTFRVIEKALRDELGYDARHFALVLSLATVLEYGICGTLISRYPICSILKDIMAWEQSIDYINNNNM